MVFYTTSINVGWDGNINGVKRDTKRTAMYTYLIEFKDRKGLPHQLMGVITAVH